jgi:hypothetical protein
VKIHRFSKNAPDVKDYNIWAVCISEVEVDILTGEKQVCRGIDLWVIISSGATKQFTLSIR